MAWRTRRINCCCCCPARRCLFMDGHIHTQRRGVLATSLTARPAQAALSAPPRPVCTQHTRSQLGASALVCQCGGYLRVVVLLLLRGEAASVCGIPLPTAALANYLAPQSCSSRGSGIICQRAMKLMPRRTKLRLCGSIRLTFISFIRYSNKNNTRWSADASAHHVVDSHSQTR